MLLVIEDRDDPAGGIAMECDMPGSAELAYIPAIRVFFEEEPAQVRRDCALQLFRRGWHQDRSPAEDGPAPGAPLISLYREALLRTGWPAPDPAKGPAENGAGRLSQRA